MNKQITLKFVAQSGNVWEETVAESEMDREIEAIVSNHGDIERVEKLASPDDMSGEIVWRHE